MCSYAIGDIITLESVIINAGLLLHTEKGLCSGLFKPFSCASFIPVEKIQEACIICDVSINGEVVTAINPIKKKYSYEGLT